MRLVRTLVVVVVGLALVAAPSAQAAGKGDKAKKAHAVRGVVAEVKKDADKDAGTITVKVAAKKNKKTGQETPAEEKKIKVTGATKFTMASGKKGEQKEETATFAALKDGERVVVEVKGDEAVTVKFHAAKKSKKNK